MKIIIYASHIESFKKLNLVKYNIENVLNNVDKIYVIYSTKGCDDDFEIKNNLKNFCVNKNIEIHNVENNGYDFWKYKHGIEIIKNIEYEYVILMNDSFTIVRQIDDIFKNINKKILEDKYEYLGFLESSDGRMRHYQSWFWVFSPITLKYFNENILTTKYDNKIDNIRKYELGGSNQLIKMFKSTSLFNFNVKRNIFYHHPDKYIKIFGDIFPIVKNNLFSNDFMNFNKLRDKRIDSKIPDKILKILL